MMVHILFLDRLFCWMAVLRHNISFILLLGLFFAFLTIHHQAIAATGPNLMLFPTRVVMDGRDRGADISLVNNGVTESTYRIELVDNTVMDREVGHRILEQGEVYPYSAKDYIRLSPRRVTLPPGSNQKIRLLLRKPKDLPDGEYRCYLRIVSTPPVKPSQENKAAEQRVEKGFSIKLTPHFNFMMPIIFRHGETYFETTFSDIEVIRDSKTGKLSYVKVAIKKEGNRSVVGDIDLYYQPQTGGKPIPFAKLAGVVMYREATYRIYKVPLLDDLPKNFDLSGGVVRATLTLLDDSKEGSRRESRKKEIVAEATLPL